MCMFVCADSVLVHRLTYDSLMTSCPHITSLTTPHSEGWQEQRRKEEEGAKQQRNPQDAPEGNL